MAEEKDIAREVPLRVSLIRPDAKIPVRATPGSSGLDLYACLEGDDSTMKIGADPVLVPTGIALEVPLEFDVQVRPRSGLTRQGVMVPLGTIDSDYRGEIFVTMYTIGTRGAHEVRHGDRIAQLVIAPLATAQLVPVAELSNTERGPGGHGSTGV